MICPRCESEEAYKIFEAPEDPKLWEVFRCPRCNFAWRNTEEELVTDPKQYPSKFKLSEKQIRELQPKPPIPPLRGGNRR